MSKQEILDFQARWMRPAGIVAILAAGLLVAAYPISNVGRSDNRAEELQLYHDHASRFLLASVISGIALVVIALPFLFLFRSARSRSDRVRAPLGAVVAVGAVLLAVQGVVLSIGLKEAADAFVVGVPGVEAHARAQPTPAKPPVTATTQKNGGGSTATTGTASTATTTTTTQTPAQRAEDAKIDFADDKVNDNGKVKVGTGLTIFGVLGLIGGGIYVLLWSMRTGLLTRFMARLGMVFLVLLVLLRGVGPLGLVLWLAVLGLMLAGWWVRPLPPAWAAGEAIPWPRPGEGPGQPGGAPPGTVEGSGREVSEPPLAENGATAEQPTETPGQRRKKRKRRK